MMLLTRKIKFSAAHTCRYPDWTDNKNEHIYGACAKGSGHGHDYSCELTVKGPINSRTGVVVNLTDIKKVLATIVGRLDRTHLNYDEPVFKESVPTTEMLTLVIWRRIQPVLEACEIFRIRLWESRRRYIEYSGENNMVDVTRCVEFNAAHRLHSQALSNKENAALFGKCNNPNGHGHNYTLEVTVRGSIDERTGMVMALGDLDEVIHREVIERYDHKNLNKDLEEFQTRNPTSEEFARVIWQRLAPHFSTPALYKVRLIETSNNSFEYYGKQEI